MSQRGFFKASTHYGDWKGTAAADEDATRDLSEYLKDKGLIQENEFLLAISMFTGEGATLVRAFVSQGNNLDSVQRALEETAGPIPVREIEVKLTSEEFLDLFKDIEIMLTYHGLELEDREYLAQE